jgi:hypothetical protein
LIILAPEKAVIKLMRKDLSIMQKSGDWTQRFRRERGGGVGQRASLQDRALIIDSRHALVWNFKGFVLSVVDSRPGIAGLPDSDTSGEILARG